MAGMVHKIVNVYIMLWAYTGVDKGGETIKVFLSFCRKEDSLLCDKAEDMCRPTRDQDNLHRCSGSAA